jgi:hypothetical protein
MSKNPNFDLDSYLFVVGAGAVFDGGLTTNVVNIHFNRELVTDEVSRPKPSEEEIEKQKQEKAEKEQKELEALIAQCMAEYGPGGSFENSKFLDPQKSDPLVDLRNEQKQSSNDQVAVGIDTPSSDAIDSLLSAIDAVKNAHDAAKETVIKDESSWVDPEALDQLSLKDMYEVADQTTKEAAQEAFNSSLKDAYQSSNEAIQRWIQLMTDAESADDPDLQKVINYGLWIDDERRRQGSLR